MDKGNRSITLKPEGTAGTVRAYLENSLYAESQPTKLFTLLRLFVMKIPERKVKHIINLVLSSWFSKSSGRSGTNYSIDGIYEGAG